MAPTATSVRGRRWFLMQASRSVLGVAVLGLATACSTDNEKEAAGGPGHSSSAAGLDWWRVDFAYVSAYVLVRGHEAALIDCGLGSRVEELGAVLGAAGTGWDRVRHVLITHAHLDHHHALGEVADRAPGAALYAGEEDANSIDPFDSFSRRRVRSVTDGEEVFGLQVVTTPGHTRGHIAVFDPDSRVLVAGDAISNTIDGLQGPMAEFTFGQQRAEESVRKLAALEPQVILVGHGPPVLRDAAAQLQRLASSQ
ncbi:MBL fold metallo-hydrolase [Nocardioides sp. GCM10028917]|uniref:MBL fold metallo-hydrolase n=1 Tax=Nocardioides sp. GCM10028917 TaxID=3273408 RepID=UPI0036116975